jgi:hypothetical protein
MDGERRSMMNTHRIARRSAMWTALVAVGVATLAAGWAWAQETDAAASAKAQVEAAIEKIRAAGEPVTLSALVPPAVPDAENAFPILKRAAAKLVDAPAAVDEAVRALAESKPAEWNRRDIATLRDYVEKNREALELARQGARLPKYRSDTEWEKGFEMALPHMSEGRKLVRLLSYAARLDLADRKIDDAIDTCADGLRIASHIGAEPILIGRLVEIACRQLTLDALKQVLRETKEAGQAERVLRILGELAPQPRMRAVLMTERVAVIDFYRKLGAGKTSLSEVMGETDQELKPENVDADMLAYLDIMSRYIALADKPYCEIRERVAALDKESQERPGAIAGLVMPAISRVYETEADATAAHEVMLVGAAIRVRKLRHLGLPGDLADLVPEMLPQVPADPYTGKPLLYQKFADGFVVYSVGRNLVDDMGFPGKDRTTGDIAYSEE